MSCNEIVPPHPCLSDLRLFLNFRVGQFINAKLFCLAYPRLEFYHLKWDREGLPLNVMNETKFLSHGTASEILRRIGRLSENRYVIRKVG